MRKTSFDLKVEFSREVDGRWIADVPALPGVTVYGRTRKQALVAVEALALRVIADRMEYGESVPEGLAGFEASQRLKSSDYHE
jgi:predicted RNase H-like HicB family nuclease